MMHRNEALQKELKPNTRSNKDIEEQASNKRRS